MHAPSPAPGARAAEASSTPSTRRGRSMFAVALAPVLFLVIATTAAFEQSLAAQVHRLHKSGPNWVLESLATGTMRPFDMWTTRLANAAFDRRFTDEVVAHLDDYQRYGVNTLVVSLQGGSFGSQVHPRVYDANGGLILTSPVWANMRRLLRETDQRGMVMMVQFWHFVGAGNVPTEAGVLRATRNAAAWFRSTGHQHYVYDVVNEFMIGAYRNRPIFATLNGALKLISAVRQQDPARYIGISPTNAWFWPAGYNGPNIVAADFIIGHNQTASRHNRGGYRLGVSPPDPSRVPAVNNEFWHAIPYERTARTNPRSGLKDWGHFDATDTQLYFTDLKALRADGGFGGIHSRRQQHVPAGAVQPVAAIGPEGEQPEAAPGRGEPSMHWLFREIARLRKFGPLAARHDFDRGYASGFERGLAGGTNRGQWFAHGGVFRKRTKIGTTAARFVGDAGDFELAFDAHLVGGGTSKGWFSVQVGGANTSLGGYRLRVGPSTVVLDDGLAASRFSRQVPMTRAAWNHFRLIVRDGRLKVIANGAAAVDVQDPIKAAGRNVTVAASGSEAAIDNVRFSPIRVVDFDDRTTGAWTAAANWQVASGAWRGTATQGPISTARLDRELANAAFACTLDVSAGDAELILRAKNVETARPSGCALVVASDGRYALHGIANGKRTTLASGQRTWAAPAKLALRTTLTGSRLVIDADGRQLVDVVLGARIPERGAIALRPVAGVITVDDIDVTVEPNAPPTVATLGPEPQNPSRPITVDIHDADGLRDIASIKLAVSFDGRTFVDASSILFTPALFSTDYALERSTTRFVANAGVRLPSAVHCVRVTVTDRRGQRTSSMYVHPTRR